jgi:hypothetical protein
MTKTPREAALQAVALLTDLLNEADPNLDWSDEWGAVDEAEELIRQGRDAEAEQLANYTATTIETEGE